MNRSEHLIWTKQRAMEYLPDDPAQALASFFSDMRKHEELETHSALELGEMLMLGGHLYTAKDVGNHIQGYN